MKTTTLLLAALSVLLPSPALAQRVEGGAFVTYTFLEEVGSNDHGPGHVDVGARRPRRVASRAVRRSRW